MIECHGCECEFSVEGQAALCGSAYVLRLSERSAIRMAIQIVRSLKGPDAETLRNAIVFMDEYDNAITDSRRERLRESNPDIVLALGL